MGIEKGYIKLYRKIFDNPAYFSEPFCRNMAWVDLMMLANHSGKFFRIRGIRVDVKRGQVGYGLNDLASRWKWSRGKVERFLNELEKDEQIIRQKTNITTLITICNYDYYQANDNTNEIPNDNTNRHQTVNQTDIKQQTKRNQTIKEKKEKNVINVKNGKKDYIDQLLDRWADEYKASRGIDYIITNRGKERSAISKILEEAKKRTPGQNGNEVKKSFKAYFKSCLNISDKWLFDNMSPPIIWSHFNKIQNQLSNGKTRQFSKANQLSEIDYTIFDRKRRHDAV